jgi:hypothetical protein
MSVLNSAAKIVFILMAAAVVAGLFLGKIESKDFMVLASMAFAFYFVTPNNPSDVAGSGK